MRFRSLPLALALAPSGTTSAAPPPASIAVTSASAAMSASAATSAPGASTSAAVLHGADVPVGASPAPSLVDWENHARFVAPNRGETGPCTLATLREWVRVRCPQVPGAGLVAGDPSGVEVALTEGSNEGDGHDTPVVTTLVFPVRRGAALVFSFLALGIDYNSDSLVEGGTLSVVWRASKADPALVMHNVPAAPSFTPGAAGDWE
jgi:hypothetical protein